MRIEFDPTKPTETAIVAALLAVMHGGGAVNVNLKGSTATLVPRDLAPGEMLQSADDEQEDDPAAAFGGVSAEQAFTPAPGAAGLSAGDGAGAASPPGVEIDKEGLPWDARIHSTPATITKTSGLWRAKRGLDDATKAGVTAELKRAMAAPAPVVAGNPVPPPPPAAVPTAPSAASDAGSPPAATPAPDSPAPPPPPPPPPLAPASAAPVASFADLMRKITGMQTAGTLSVEQTQEISKSLGIDGVRNLMQRPDLIPAFDALLPVAG